MKRKIKSVDAMTKDKEIEYVVRDYSAVDAQVDEIARREKEKTRQLQISNLTKLVFLGLYILAGIALLILVCGIAYRIAFPPKIEVIEKTEIIEKVVEPQPIIIQTPPGTSTSSENTQNENAKFFGENKNSNNSTSTNSKNQTSTTTISENETSSNSQKQQDNSVIGKRSVTTFTTVPSLIKNFGDVTTGWVWQDINSKRPENEYCYVLKYVGSDELRYQIATKDFGMVNKNSLSQVQNSGLTFNQLQNLISKCRWFPN